MVIRNFRGYLVAIAVAALAIASSAYQAIELRVLRAVDWLISTLAPAFDHGPRFALDGGPSLSMDGRALDASLQHSLRHEANHDHRSAARKV